MVEKMTGPCFRGRGAMDPNKIYTGGIFRLRRTDDQTLQIVMPEDAASFGLFWVRALYPDGSVFFRPDRSGLNLPGVAVLLSRESIEELEKVRTDSCLSDIDGALRLLINRYRTCTSTKDKKTGTGDSAEEGSKPV
ncbi:MAG: hypothetical protein LUQ13_02795 [Methanomicrobiales archaeon]|nr:hypothetical protein [Methanomicrobiales archaeon]